MPKISAKAVGDSISPKGIRITTLELGFPRFILPEYNTHRDFSRNSASSRAVPIKKQIEQVLNDPALPIIYGTNMAGMQSRDPLPEELAEACKETILDLRLEAISKVEELSQLGLHKQWTNRYLEPWLWHTVVCTATRWENFFHQRLHEDAQPEIKELAACMYRALEDSQPVEIDYDDWHLPYLVQSDSIYNLEDRMKISAARCAGVSYLNQGKVDAVKDLARFEKLITANPPHCYDSETEILTDRGFIPFKNLTEFDTVATVNSNGFVYERPSAIIVSDYDGEMYAVEHPKVSLLVTPNHKMFVSKRTNHGLNGIEWNEADLVEASILGDSSMIRYFKSSPYEGFGLSEDGLRTPNKVYSLVNEDNLALLELIGFFLGDGFAGPVKNQDPNHIRFHLRVPRKIEYLHSLVERLGWEMKCSGDNYAINISGIGSLFRELFYSKDSKKRIPYDLTFVTRTQALAILEGLKNSDGSLKRNTWVYDSTSEELIKAVEILIIHAGLSSSTSFNGYKYRIGIHTSSDPVINQSKMNTSTTPYTGKVYCVTTSTGVIIVKRKGQVVLSGNSSPLEHVATPFYSWLPWRKPLGNFDGWSQYRHNLNSKKEKLR